MKKISFLFVGLFTLGSLFTAGACGDETTSTNGMGGTGGGDGGSGGSGGAGTGGTGGTGGAGGGMATLDCNTYCSAIMANCSGMNAQYGDMAACMGACGAFEVGKAADTSGNTLGCRIYHGGAPAKGEPTVHCEHAGPGGADTCGSDCEGFCAIATKTCPTEHPSVAECMTTCMGFTDDKPYNASVTSGDSLACRLYHLTVATLDDATHCPHTAAMSMPCK